MPINKDKLIKLIVEYGHKQYLVGRYVGQRNHEEFTNASDKAFEKIESHIMSNDKDIAVFEEQAYTVDYIDAETIKLTRFGR